MTTDAERAAFNEQCYPRGLADEQARIQDAYRGLRFHRTVDGLALSLLSDAQELIEMHQRDAARRHINYVKWLLMERDKLAPLVEG